MPFMPKRNHVTEQRYTRLNSNTDKKGVYILKVLKLSFLYLPCSSSFFQNYFSKLLTL